MRFGGPILKPFNSPGEWLALVKEMNYTAVYFPVDHTAPDALIDEYAALARENDLLIAEIGVWRNTLSSDPAELKTAMDYAKNQLALAERVGAACCVNIAGSCGAQWDGPHAANFTRETFDRIVASVREIIDAVQPQKTFYTLEPMPWMYPHTADAYLALLDAVDRKAFAAHLDPVNVITNPHDYYRSGALIREWFDKLGAQIKSCHAKDILLEGQLTVHLNEQRPGAGELDFAAYIECVKRYANLPLMMEHMHKHEDVVLADAYIRSLM